MRPQNPSVAPINTTLFLISFSLSPSLPYRPRGLPTLVMLSKSVQSSSIIRAAHWDSTPSVSSTAPSCSPSHAVFFSPRPPPPKKLQRDCAPLRCGDAAREEQSSVCVQYLHSEILKRLRHFGNCFEDVLYSLLLTSHGNAFHQSHPACSGSLFSLHGWWNLNCSPPTFAFLWNKCVRVIESAVLHGKTALYMQPGLQDLTGKHPPPTLVKLSTHLEMIVKCTRELYSTCINALPFLRYTQFKLLSYGMWFSLFGEYGLELISQVVKILMETIMEKRGIWTDRGYEVEMERVLRKKERESVHPDGNNAPWPAWHSPITINFIFLPEHSVNKSRNKWTRPSGVSRRK